MKGQNLYSIFYQLIAIISVILTINLSFNEAEYLVETEEEPIEWSEELADHSDNEYGAGNDNFISPKVYFPKSRLFLFLNKGICNSVTCFSSQLAIAKVAKLYILFQQLKLHLQFSF
jgi:hypothetical protein